MKFITMLHRHKSIFYTLFGFSFFASCGSYQYVGLSEDGIYGSSENVEYRVPTEHNTTENKSSTKKNITNEKIANFFNTKLNLVFLYHFCIVIILFRL